MFLRLLVNKIKIKLLIYKLVNCIEIKVLKCIEFYFRIKMKFLIKLLLNLNIWMVMLLINKLFR